VSGLVNGRNTEVCGQTGSRLFPGCRMESESSVALPSLDRVPLCCVEGG